MKNSFIEVDFDPFKDIDEIEKIIQINESQKEIWLACVIGGNEASLAYNESISLDLTGDFHIDYFVESINQVVARHEALRSTITPGGESFIVYKNRPLEIVVEDISSISDQTLVLSNFVSREMRVAFDLERGPLFKAFIHKLSDTHYYFTMVAHHIICDGWSFGVILEEISKIYNSKVNNHYLSLDRPAQISDYAIEMADFRSSKGAESVKDYWSKMYEHSIPVINLPTDFPRPLQRTFAANRIDQQISQELIDQVKKLAANHGCSVVNVLISAFEIFLCRKTNNPDVVVAIAASGQANTGNLNLVGHCVNSLSIRSFVDTHLSFSEYVLKRKSEFLDAYENQNFVFGELIKTLNIKRDSSRIPLAPVAFNIDWGMDDVVSFDGLNYKLISNPRAFETFEIFLNITGSQSSFILEWSYNTQLFKASTIKRFSDEYQQLLQNIADAPPTTIKQLFSSSAKVADAKFGERNNTHTYYPKESNIFALIEQTTHKFPNNAAISFNRETISYSSLISYAEQLAVILSERGIKVGDIVGLAINRSNEMMIAMLGILRAGGIYVPLDPEYPLDRIEYVLEDSNARILLISKQHSGKYKSQATEIIIEDIWNDVINNDKPVPYVDVKGTDLAYLLYTSGSTGKPKGVKVRHFNVINFLVSMGVKPGMSPTDKLLAITTISFDVSVYELFVPLVYGAEVVIADKEATADPRILLDIIRNNNISVLLTTPSTWSTMIDSGWTMPYPLKVLCGGEALPKSLADKLLLRASEVWNMYGPTETTACTTLKQITKEDETINIGWPIANAQVYILNDNNEQVLPGVIGEILIGGEGVTAGYLNLPDLTDERFIDDPFSKVPGAKLYKTGDLGKFFDNGDIQYLGRTDQQVKIRGLRIELGEIDTVLSVQEEIKEVITMAVEDAPGDARLVAYIILEHHHYDFQTLINSWKENLKLKLPQYMVPSSFIVVDAFPLTANSKIDKKALAKIKPVTAKSAKIVSLPETNTEKLLYLIWSEVLNITNFDIDDDFFEIGGHSLLAVKMMSALEKQTGNRLPLAMLFDSSTIRKLAKEIDLTKNLEFKTIAPIKPEGTKSPVYLIHGGGLNVLLFKYISKYLDINQPVFGIQAFGLTDDTPIPPTIEDIAANHIEEILKNQPSGQYALAGYSLGGYIAFEIARQLKAMGKEVSMLGIIDTYAGSNSLPDPIPMRVIKKVKRQFYKAPFFAKSFINNPGETLNYQSIVFKHKLQMLFMPNSVIAKEVLTPKQMETYKIYDNARANYVLKPLDIKITLFRVKKRLYYLDDNIYLGWKPLTTKGVEVYEIPGDHKTFLYPPNDIEFASVLQNALNAY